MEMEPQLTDPRGTIYLALVDKRLWCRGLEVKLTPRAFEVLRILMLSGNRLQTKSEILRKVWPTKYVSEGIVKEYIRDIRRALDDDPRNPKFIETVHSRGYRFIGTVHTLTCGDGSGTANAIAVIPFDHGSATHETKNPSNILCDCIIDGITDCPHLRVVPRKYISSLQERGFDLPSLGSELNVDYIVDGAIRSNSGSIRVDANIIDVKTSKQVWAKHYDCLNLNDNFFVERIGNQIADEVTLYTQNEHCKN